MTGNQPPVSIATFYLQRFALIYRLGLNFIVSTSLSPSEIDPEDAFVTNESVARLGFSRH